MSRVKDIKVKVIPSKVAIPFVKQNHYSGSVTQNSQLHFGAFLDGVLHGVMSFGPSLDKRKTIGLVKDTTWNGFLELNRMAFDEKLPRNSESRCISIALKLIKKNAPHVKWVISFADGTQCGDGTIYRASGFVLTQININKSILEAPNGDVKTDISLRLALRAGRIDNSTSVTKGKSILSNGASSMKPFKDAGYKPKIGFQLRYIYFLDPAYRTKLTVPEIPFSEIEKRGASMYKGKRLGSVDSCTLSDQDESGGANPTPRLSKK